MKKYLFLILALTFGSAWAEMITVYKSKTCGCCVKWVEIMEKAGHEVKVNHPFDLKGTKKKLGVPAVLGSCHTAVIGDYVFEGHIPEKDILNFLANPPSGAIGLAVPGMPAMSPGMAPKGKPYKDISVIAFDKNGNMSLFNKY